MTVVVLRPEGDVFKIDIAHPVYVEAVMPAMSWSLSDDGDQSPVPHEHREYRDSRCITDGGVPVWTVDGKVPSFSPPGWRFYQRTEKVWARVLVTTLELAQSRMSDREIAWLHGRETVASFVPNPVFLSTYRENADDSDDIVSFMVIAEGRVPIRVAALGPRPEGEPPPPLSGHVTKGMG